MNCKLDEDELKRMEELLSLPVFDRRNWRDDSKYEMKCHYCNNIFIGNKDRIFCRECENFSAFARAAIAEIRLLRAENEALREQNLAMNESNIKMMKALEYYADPDNYHEEQDADGSIPSSIQFNEGAVAREALEVK